MSFETIKTRFGIPVINGFVQPPDEYKTNRTSITVAAAMAAISGARLVDYRRNVIITDPAAALAYCFCNTKLILELPERTGADGFDGDYHTILRAL